MYTYNNMLYKRNKTHFSDFEFGLLLIYFGCLNSILLKLQCVGLSNMKEPVVTFSFHKISKGVNMAASIEGTPPYLKVFQ